MFKKSFTKTLVVFAAAIIGIVQYASAQAPVTLWEKTFGGSSMDQASSVQQTNDGGYILAGNTSSYGAGYSDAWLIKTDAQGDTLWTRTFGGKYTEKARSVQQTNDGGYILVGEKYSWGNGQPDAWLIKTDAQGDTLWTRKFGKISISGSRRDDYARSVQQTNDGGYVLAGYSYSVVGHRQINYDAWLIKTDAEGNKLWDKTFGDSDEDEFRSVQQTNDGGYILAGRTEPYGATSGYDAWLIKTDTEGNKLWDKTFSRGFLDRAYSAQQTSDGGYILVCEAWLIKTDAEGNKLWEQTFGSSDYDEFYSGQQTSDGGYVLAGLTRSSGAGGTEDAWLIKTDSEGKKEWEQTFGGSNSDEFCSVQQTNDGGYILAGYTNSYGAGSSDVWLIKLKGDSTSVSVEEYKQESKIPESFTLFQNYPNPFNPTTTITYQLPKSSLVNLSIYDINGRLVETLVNENKNAGYYSVEWNVEKVSSGIYFYRINAGEFSRVKKCLVVK